MKPAQVLDLQADLMVRSVDPVWQSVMRAHIEADYEQAPGKRGAPSPHAAANAAIIVDRLHDVVQRAAAYYVAPEMTELVTWAAAGLDDTDAFRMDEVPTREGFAYFPEPLVVVDVRGVRLLINAVVWMTVQAKFTVHGVAPEYASHPGDMTVLMLFNDSSQTPDVVALELLAKYGTLSNGRWGLIGMHGIPDGMRIGPPLLETPEEDWNKVDMPEGMEPMPVTNVFRMMHAYWLMLNQEITLREPAEIPRAFAKRARRMSIPDRVTVVALRRVAGHSHGETHVDWQHRWMVRGHWRWQHVSEHHPLAEPDGEGGHRARVWVRPHVRGPEDKPFVLTSKVYALVR